MRQACRRATLDTVVELRRNVDANAAALAEGDSPRRAENNIEFHGILARLTGNPIMMVIVNGVLDVRRGFIRTIGEYPNHHALTSRRRFMPHIQRGDAAAAGSEMEGCFKRLQRSYLSRLKTSP